uniref:DDE superfamily endonuclease n=1 Tax=Candidatus Kentrum eta TaxID=2126337 RepID=A0A450VJ75_9GAMM|nr:MAG: DDE superfamily endonuclease [Candidatus Kentron sp. H]
MESMLEVCHRPQDPQYPVVCMDETTVQCVKEVRTPIPARPGHTEHYDAEYERNGVAHLLMFYDPFENRRRVDVADNHTAKQWAEGVRKLAQEDYPEARRIALLMDNLNTHTGASLYKTFPPALARELMDKSEFVHTPKHGSWLDMAECELSVSSRQCTEQRLADVDTAYSEIIPWTKKRNQSTEPVHWRFTTNDARVKLNRLYPKLSK